MNQERLVRNIIGVCVLLAVAISIYQGRRSADVEVQKLQVESSQKQTKQDEADKKRQETINRAYARCREDGGVMISGFYRFTCIQSSCVKWEQAYGQHDIW